MSPDFWSGKSVFLTGHTGFKGAWLTAWLLRLGARVHGYALDPATSPSLYDLLGLCEKVESDIRADVRDASAVQAAMSNARPDVVLHLAAQPLVRDSYADPLGTLATNVLGTANVLEAARRCENLGAVVVITTDKCYENHEWSFPYRESDSLGGHDPYSSSKACAEIVAASWRASFFAGETAPRIATARAGNVIGGGDWAKDRLIPDCVRAFASGQPVRLRYPQAVRPWQHVMDPLMGYLMLAEKLCKADGGRFANAWNFGPDLRGDATVLQVATTMANALSGRVELATEEATLHEATTLRLDSTRSQVLLGWKPRWMIDLAIDHTAEWYRAWQSHCDVQEFTESQICRYQEDAGFGVSRPRVGA